MNNEAQTRLKGLFSCFPQSPDIDPLAYLGGLILACEGVGDEAIIEAVENIVTGKANAEGINPNFCPSTAAFGAYVRKLDERNKLVAQRISRPAIEGPKQEPDKPFKQEGTAEERKARAEAILRKFRKDDDHAN